MALSVDAEDDEADRQGPEQLVIVEFDRRGKAGIEQEILATRREATARTVVVLGHIDSQGNVRDGLRQAGTHAFQHEVRFREDRHALRPGGMEIDRLFDLRHASKFDQIEAAANVLGKHVQVQIT